MLNPKQPLWLPQGSVRALLAIILIVSTVILAVQGQIEARVIAELAGIVAAFYFAAKASEKNPPG